MRFKVWLDLHEIPHFLPKQPMLTPEGAIYALDLRVEQWPIDNHLKQIAMSPWGGPLFGTVGNKIYKIHDMNVTQVPAKPPQEEISAQRGMDLDILPFPQNKTWWDYAEGQDADNKVIKMPQAERGQQIA